MYNSCLLFCHILKMEFFSSTRAWLDGVFPLVMDRETSASEKCLEILDEVIISNIVPYQR